MGDKTKLSLAAKKARLVAAEFDRVVAEIERLVSEAKRLAAPLGIVVNFDIQEEGAAPRKRADWLKKSSALSVEELAEHYRTDDRSPYQTVRPASRRQYDKLIKYLIQHCGKSKVADLAARDRVQALYEKCVAGDKIAMGHAVMTKLRGLAHFGMNELENTDCKNLAFTLHTMTFPTVKLRKEGLTVEQAEAIRAKAHELGFHSIALAQAFQFDCMLSQKDVIGEWVSNNEPGVSEVTDGINKWLYGIRWSEIDDDLILRHPPSAGGEIIRIELSRCRMVMEEIKRLGSRPKSGPIIVKDDTKQPYSENTFRYLWRKAANAADAPKNIYNRDSRPPIEREIRSRRSYKR